MQVANALNNIIRILFNPKVEPFKLFDFLVVKSVEDRYLAQIVEIYEDKFDSSQNVAKLKLFYKITSNNEVMPYDNFTPSKECEIIKVNPDEVEDFINSDKKTFIFATDVKTSQSLNIQYDFFKENAIVLADKIENSNALSLNLAKKLSSDKNVILLDFTGVVDFEESKKIVPAKNFKMPLNYETLDLIFEICLSDASLEFQAIGLEIITAIKKFAKKQENGFIPFNAFVNVIMQQYEATPYPELQLLLSRMKKYQMYDIFVRNKKDYETLSKTFKDNQITIIDLSALDNVWRKAYVEYIISEINDESYLISRINDDCFDNELISKIYNKKQNITFVPTVSYNYSKLPSIIQYCQNYILMPSLYQRNDFLDANFALSNLISDGCILFGKNTDNFLYIARDYELEIQEKRKNYRKIELSSPNLGEMIDTEQTTSDSQRLINELSNVDTNSGKEYRTSVNIVEDSHDEFQEIVNDVQSPQEDEEKFEDDILESEDIQKIAEPSKEVVKETIQEDFEEVYKQDVPVQNDIEEVKLSNDKQEVETLGFINETPEENIDEVSDEIFDEIPQEDELDEQIIQEQEIMSVEQPDNQEIEQSESFADYEEAQIEQTENQEKIEQFDEVLKNEEPEINNEKPILENQQLVIDNNQETTLEKHEVNIDNNQEIEISDEELDFFELAKDSQEILDSSNDAQNNNILIDDVEYKLQSDNSENIIIDSTEDKNEDDLDLSAIATNSIENNFKDIINSKNAETKQTFEIDENTKIQVDVETQQKENLPIFKEDKKESSNNEEEFVVGNTVIHAKYGKGKITKIIQYDQRKLLQIDFASSGKKLLDPKIAEIQLEQ